MPIYDYRCAACDAPFELLVRSDTPIACPTCGGADVERLMSVPARPAGGGKAAGLSRLPAPRGGCCGGGCHTHSH
jgi:putative FmdB family regulatory protein